ncbi:SDR family NAD(P)-dependent oxidoreductase [Streptomyces sp. 3214.6]|uniref:SDR family NAD(P)-dependent oxidoreductase n=1 Tax=Streptomyces sp. 3214.6 TaxID=1882757 RepID=UPI000909EEB6|nr:SDR family NAD(P)-dependent oxidoreductase [Streptomyces sp. 3214.6]SHI26071.1 NAD(P)-dependent dehydrogenase, short-chain alcohol dehydrogenase family [Streptomyces sp. 3214.6]
MNGLKDRVVIVTGAGKGLGRAFALDLAARGARVIVNNRNRQVDENGLGPADHVVREIQAAGGTAVADHGAVEDPATADRLVATALEHWGRLDGLVTSAAVSGPQMLHSTTPENFANVLAVNVTGTVLVTTAASRVMRQAGHGRIVLIASTAGLYGEPTVSAYAASKGAVIALGRTAAVEGERRGVLTNVVLPYATTQMTAGAMDPTYVDLMSAESVAPLVSSLIDPRSTANGQVIVAAAGSIRAADAIEGATVRLPDGPLDPSILEGVLKTSRDGVQHTFPEAQAAFQDFAADVAQQGSSAHEESTP